MAIDLKYGWVMCEYTGPEEDEVVVVFRGRDEVLPKLLETYRQLCQEAGSPEHHLLAIDTSKEFIEDWQAKHSDRVRTPTSDSFVKRVDTMLERTRTKIAPGQSVVEHLSKIPSAPEEPRRVVVDEPQA